MFKAITRPLSLAMLSSALLLSNLISPGLSQTGPSVDKASVLVWASTRGMYYPKPGQGDETRSAWLPNIGFRLNGPIEVGTKVEVQYSIQDKPWISLELSPDPRPAGRWFAFDREGSRVSDEKATLETGPVTVTIKAVNELSGLHSLLYKGTLDVKKYHYRDPKQFPNFKNKFDYYVEQDWRLPFGFLTGSWSNSNDINGVEHTPLLFAKIWFRGSDVEQIEGHLYHNGKQVAKARGDSATTVSASESTDYSWTLVSFNFTGMNSDPVIFYDTSGKPAAHTHFFNLNQNPGDYELKVLHKGELSRSMRFSVGPSGRIVDNGFSTQLALPDSWTLPVKVLKQTDGKWNQDAWKLGAFYANPLSGFKLP
ncbi:MAG: hypothetical protein CVV27_11920 [Candidatus Melainabacteria bacterium HGW-Melainabacteria-1]|nr:MAG: hypothetical protein CVV27_11920 [Candidatus Melainabacteria bacterium HGW-Melainabacteria-1]